MIEEEFEESFDIDEQIKESFDVSKLFSVTGKFDFNFMIEQYTGNYEVKQTEDTYHGEAKILMSNGKQISIRNKFVLKESNDIKNILTITTPFKSFETVTSNFALKVPESGFSTRFDISTPSRKDLSSTYGFKINYQQPENGMYKIHDVKFVLLYPMKNSSTIKIGSRIELSTDSIHLAEINIDGFGTVLKIQGESEVIIKVIFILTFL